MISRAVEILNTGGLVAFPTETVYGLGADATNESAINKIYTLKERPLNHPLIVHIAKLEDIAQWVLEMPTQAIKLAQNFWPGPLTMLLKKRPGVLDILTAGQNTIGLRIPKHPAAQELLHAFGGGIAAPSANKFTRISPTTAAAVYEEFGHTVDLILDGGACEVGLESTIIDMTSESPVILRPGMIGTEAIGSVLNMPVVPRQKKTSVLLAPGMHYLHYAPRTRSFLIATNQIHSALQALQDQDLPIAFVVHSEDIVFPSNPKIKGVLMSKDATLFAHDLYHILRTLDSQNYKRIMIETVPDNAEWDAIRDRIFKATASR